MPSTSKVISVRSVENLQCPFLYQTRTILQHQVRRYRVRYGVPSVPIPQHGTPAIKATSSTSRSESLEPRSFLKQKAAQVAAGRPQSGSSITPVEQAAFDSIMALFKKPAPSTAKARATSTDHSDTDYKNILDLFSAPSTALDDDIPDRRDEEQLFIERRSKKSGRSGSATLSPGPSKLNREGAMAEIQGFLQENASPDQVVQSSTSQPADAVRSAALEIGQDVADSLTAALKSQDPRPDIAMWQVAEEKIFPLIRLLKVPTSSLSTPPQPNQSADGRSDDAQPKHEPQPAHPLIPNDVPLLPLLSLVYPSLTLLILRLYATHQPASPYALALLPTLKSLGPTSYVLGAHTHFYNALLSLSWRVYSDLRGMNDLLVEMDTNGVEFDIGTWEAVSVIEEDRQRDLNGGGSGDGDGGRGMSWWARVEQAAWWRRVGVEWKAVISRSLEGKGSNPQEVMREDASTSRIGIDSSSRPDYVVTL